MKHFTRSCFKSTRTCFSFASRPKTKVTVSKVKDKYMQKIFAIIFKNDKYVQQQEVEQDKSSMMEVR